MGVLSVKELRLGNYIEYNIGGYKEPRDWVLNKVDAQDIMFFEGRKLIQDYRSIRLCFEKMERFGFKPCKSRIGISTTYVKEGVKIEFSTGRNVYYKKLPISSVHQLQNLYFALTNKELTF